MNSTQRDLNYSIALSNNISTILLFILNVNRVLLYSKVLNCLFTIYFGAGLSLYSIFQESVMVGEKKTAPERILLKLLRGMCTPPPFSFMNIQSCTFMGVNVC
jgi:hypothetical protein